VDTQSRATMDQGAAVGASVRATTGTDEGGGSSASWNRQK
jgi:hypothetical protein